MASLERESKIEKIIQLCEEPKRFSEIKKAIKITDMGLTKNLQSLIKQGFIIKTEDGKYVLTDKGRRELEKIKEARTRAAVYEIDQIATEETIKHILRKVHVLTGFVDLPLGMLGISLGALGIENEEIKNDPLMREIFNTLDRMGDENADLRSLTSRIVEQLKEEPVDLELFEKELEKLAYSPLSPIITGDYELLARYIGKLKEESEMLIKHAKSEGLKLLSSYIKEKVDALNKRLDDLERSINEFLKKYGDEAKRLESELNEIRRRIVKKQAS